MNIGLSSLALSLIIASLIGEIAQKTTSVPVKEINLEFKPSSRPVRIKSLWPEFMAAKMAIEPAIPDNFVLFNSTTGNSSWDFIWGPKELDTECFQNPSSIKVPLLKFWLSNEVHQTGPQTFSISATIESELKKIGFKNISIKRSMWGIYPVQSLKAKKDGQFTYMAWIGMNDGSAGVLCARLVFPRSDYIALKGSMQLWDTFINNTKELSHPEFFIAMGQDLQPGYTIVDVVGGTVTFVAEKRIRDNEIQLVFIPNGQDIKFSFESMDEVLMGSEWNYKAPLLKAYGSLSQTIENAQYNWLCTVTSILLKPVEEFSITKKWIDSQPNITAYQCKGVDPKLMQENSQ